jgi:hypothetical protein
MMSNAKRILTIIALEMGECFATYITQKRDIFGEKFTRVGLEVGD